MVLETTQHTHIQQAKNSQAAFLNKKTLFRHKISTSKNSMAYSAEKKKVFWHTGKSFPFLDFQIRRKNTKKKTTWILVSEYKALVQQLSNVAPSAMVHISSTRQPPCPAIPCSRMSASPSTDQGSNPASPSAPWGISLPAVIGATGLCTVPGLL